MNGNQIKSNNYLRVNEKQPVVPHRQDAIRVHREKAVHAVRVDPICRLPVNVLVLVQLHLVVACKRASYYVNLPFIALLYLPYLGIPDAAPSPGSTSRPHNGLRLFSFVCHLQKIAQKILICRTVSGVFSFATHLEISQA